MTNLITKQFNFWIAGIVVLSISLGVDLYAHACGFLLTPDSLHYLSAAKSFHENGKFLNADGSYYSYWGPLFPILLSFFNAPQSALVWVNILCKALMMVALIRLVPTFIEDQILRVVFLIISMLSVYVALISVFVWSELIFMTLILWNASFALSIKNSSSNYYSLVITGFFACLQRDAGFFWMSGVCLWLLLDNSDALKTRIVQGLSCFLLCIAGLLAWRFYIHYVTNQNSNFYDYSFFFHSMVNAQSILAAFGKMLLPFHGILGIATGILFFSTLFRVFFRRNRNIQLLSIIISIYTLGFVALPWQLDIHEMDRYFSVITPLVFLFIISLIDEQIKHNTHLKRIAIYFVVCLWLCYPLARTYKNMQLWHEESCVANAK